MRVFGFIRQSSAAKFIMADIMYAFRRLGCDYAWLDMESWKNELEGVPTEKRGEAIDGLIETIFHFNPDLIVSYGLESFHPLFSDIVEQKNRPFFSYIPDVPFLCFIFDFGAPFTDPIPLRKIPFVKQMQAQQFLFLCWDRDALEAMKQKGIVKCVYFPMGVNEERFKIITLSPKERQRYQCDFCFIGGPTPGRIRMLQAIHHEDLKIYGYDEEQWCSSALLRKHFCHPIFSQDELVKVYNGSLASVNITRKHGKSSLNMRAYESMACGSMLLTDDKKDAWELFVPDKEIIIYTDENDLRRKAHWLNRHRSAALEIARRGRIRVLEEHTYLYRIKSLLALTERFVKEFKLLETIVSEISHKNFADATNRISAMLNSSEKPLNSDLLNSIMAQISLAKGQIWSAKQFLHHSLQANPHFIPSLKVKSDLEVIK
jgi:hypothetical protein